MQLLFKNVGSEICAFYKNIIVLVKRIILVYVGTLDFGGAERKRTEIGALYVDIIVLVERTVAVGVAAELNYRCKLDTLYFALLCIACRRFEVIKHISEHVGADNLAFGVFDTKHRFRRLGYRVIGNNTGLVVAVNPSSLRAEPDTIAEIKSVGGIPALACNRANRIAKAVIKVERHDFVKFDSIDIAVYKGKLRII